MDREMTGWTTNELAEAAGLSDSRIRQLLLAGRLGGQKFGRDWRIPDRVAREFLAEREELGVAPDDGCSEGE